MKSTRSEMGVMLDQMFDDLSASAKAQILLHAQFAFEKASMSIYGPYTAETLNKTRRRCIAQAEKNYQETIIQSAYYSSIQRFDADGCPIGYPTDHAEVPKRIRLNQRPFLVRRYISEMLAADISAQARQRIIAAASAAFQITDGFDSELKQLQRVVQVARESYFSTEPLEAKERLAALYKRINAMFKPEIEADIRARIVAQVTKEFDDKYEAAYDEIKGATDEGYLINQLLEKTRQHHDYRWNWNLQYYQDVKPRVSSSQQSQRATTSSYSATVTIEDITPPTVVTSTRAPIIEEVDSFAVAVPAATTTTTSSAMVVTAPTSASSAVTHPVAQNQPSVSSSSSAGSTASLLSAFDGLSFGVSGTAASSQPNAVTSSMPSAFEPMGARQQQLFTMFLASADAMDRERRQNAAQMQRDMAQKAAQMERDLARLRTIAIANDMAPDCLNRAEFEREKRAAEILRRVEQQDQMSQASNRRKNAK